MRFHLGKVFLIISILFHVELFASEYRWSATIDKKKAVVNEVIYLKYICEFSDRGELYSIDFNPVGNYEKYKIILLKEKQILENGTRVSSYEYIAYIKEAGLITFDFDMVMKKTTQDSINFTTKSRDDDRDNEDFSSRYMRQKSLVVDVKKTKSDLVGSFKIDVKKDETKVQAFEPYHLEIIIEGTGNFDSIKDINYEIDGVKIFTQKPKLNTTLTKDGERGYWSKKFAFVGDKDFVIPKKTISFYNTKTKQTVYQNIESNKIVVTKIYDKKELLDEVKDDKFSFSPDFLYYLLSFIFGFLVAKIDFKTKDKNITSDGSLSKKIEESKSLKELSVLLAMSDDKRYDELLDKIDNGEISSTTQIKKKINF